MSSGSGPTSCRPRPRQFRICTTGMKPISLPLPLIHGKGKEIGFMPVVQILNWRGRGLQLVGPLPDDIQNYTTYAAAPASGSDGGREFVRSLATPEAKAIF